LKESSDGEDDFSQLATQVEQQPINHLEVVEQVKDW
jgi:hypothetical protein